MSIPGKVCGAGNASGYANVIRITFTGQDFLNNPIVLEAWDDETICTTNNDIFVGTALNGNIPMLSGAWVNFPLGPNWKPAVPIAGGANPNRIKGSTNYVNIGSYGMYEFLVNLCWEIPCDIICPASLSCILVLKYTYTGPPPVIIWEFNDETDGGEPYSPRWTEIVSGSLGYVFKPTDAGVSPGNLILTRPLSGMLDNPEMWVDSS